MVYGCDMSKQLLVQYIHFNRHHNTMLMKHNDAALTRKIDELKTEMETLKANQKSETETLGSAEISQVKTEIEADNSKMILELRTELETLIAQAGPVVMVRRKEVGNPVDFFDKTFAEYQAGFEANGEKETLSNTKRGNPYFAGEKWIGLDTLHQLTSQQRYKLMVTMTDFDQKKYVAVYDQFEVTTTIEYSGMVVLYMLG